MVVYTIACKQCGGKRLARDHDGAIRPFIKECPECGETEYDILAK